jgi:hypothetical protein
MRDLSTVSNGVNLRQNFIKIKLAKETSCYSDCAHTCEHARTHKRALKRAFLYKISITAGLKCFIFEQCFYSSLLVKIFLSAVLR